jgi:hypothetical protein
MTENELALRIALACLARKISRCRRACAWLLMRLHVCKIAIAASDSAFLLAARPTAPGLDCAAKLRADCRMMFARILACREEDLAFVVLITTLALEPLVSSNAQSDMGLSSGPLPAQTTPDGNHTIIVVLSIKTRSCIIPLHTSATCGGAHGSRLWPKRDCDAVSLPVALQRSARGVMLASWQLFHRSSGRVEALRLVIWPCRAVCTPVIGRAVCHPHPRRVIAGREG